MQLRERREHGVSRDTGEYLMCLWTPDQFARRGDKCAAKPLPRDSERENNLCSQLSVIQHLTSFFDFNNRVSSALEQLQLVIQNMAAERTTREWVCEGCDTAFQVRYLQRQGTDTDFSLRECPNCMIRAWSRRHKLKWKGRSGRHKS